MEKVGWIEGLLLTQQHFQAWDHYHETLGRFYATHLAPLHWGIVALTTDALALHQGCYRVLTATVLLPNRMPLTIDLPLEYALDPTQQAASIYLGLSTQSSRQEALVDYPTTSYRAHYREYADRFDASRKAEVLYVEPTPALSIAKPDAPFVEIDRVLRGTEHSWQPDIGFAPPSLHCKHPFFATYHHRCIAALHAASFTSNDAIQKVLRPLTIRLHNMSLTEHPHVLYQHMIAVLATLSDLQDTQTLPKYPAYAHAELGKVFLEIEATLSMQLAALSSDNTHLPLQKIREDVYAVTLTAEQCERGDIGIVMARSHPEPNTLTLTAHGIAHAIKIAPLSQLEALIQSALSGIALHYTPVVRSTAHTYAFRLDKAHTLFSAVQHEKALGIFIPHSLNITITQVWWDAGL